MRPTTQPRRHYTPTELRWQLAKLRGKADGPLSRSTWNRWREQCYLMPKAAYTEEEASVLRSLVAALNSGVSVRDFQEELVSEMERKVLGVETIDIQPIEVTS